MAKTDTSRRSPPWSHGPGRSDRRDGDPRFTAEIAETAEMGPEPGGRVGRVRGTEARCALGLLGVFLGGLCGLRGESVPSLAAEPGGRVGRVRGTEARCALGLLGVFLGGLCGLCGESVPSLAAEPGELKS